MPPASAITITPVGVGESVPAPRQPGLQGNLVDLAAPRSLPIMVRFWSTGCTHCLALAPAIRPVERR